jgi:hypothetical protein
VGSVIPRKGNQKRLTRFGEPIEWCRRISFPPAARVIDEGLLSRFLDLMVYVDDQVRIVADIGRHLGLLDDGARGAGPGLQRFREYFHGRNLVSNDQHLLGGEEGGAEQQERSNQFHRQPSLGGFTLWAAYKEPGTPWSATCSRLRRPETFRSSDRSGYHGPGGTLPKWQSIVLDADSMTKTRIQVYNRCGRG